MIRTVRLLEEVLEPFAGNQALIEGLVASEVQGFQAEKLRWCVSFLPSDGKTIALTGQLTEAGFEWYDSSGGLANGQLLGCFPSLGVPGGYVGIHAFWLILENFLRNLVKHSKEAKEQLAKQGLCLFLDLEDKSGRWYRAKLGAAPYSEACKNVTHTYNSGAAGEVENILKEGFLDERMALRSEGWGTKEMLIGAAHLCGCPLIHLQDPEEALKILTPESGWGGVRYEFSLLKPQRITLVAGSSARVGDDRVKLEHQGVNLVETIAKDQIVLSEYLVFCDGHPDLPEGATPLRSFDARTAWRDKSIEELVSPWLEKDEELWNTLADLEKAFAERLIGRGKTVTLAIAGEQALVDNSGMQANGLTVKVVRQAPVNENGLVVFLDNHGYRWQEIWERENVLWEPWSSGSPTAFLLQHPPQTKTARLHLAWTIVTAACCKVAVLDERMQARFWENGNWRFESSSGARASNEKRPGEWLKRMGIFIACPKVSLEDPQQEKLTGWLASTKPHLVSIHAGVLDKLGMKKPSQVCDWIQEIKKQVPGILRLVVHSGRGIPVNVPDLKVPFLSFSAIEHALAGQETKSKYVLVQELLAARGIRRR